VRWSTRIEIEYEHSQPLVTASRVRRRRRRRRGGDERACTSGAGDERASASAAPLNAAVTVSSVTYTTPVSRANGYGWR